MICDINVSATFSITVTEDFYSQLSSVMWIGELMKVLRIAANNVIECELVEQQEGWVLWVSVSVGNVCYSRRWSSSKEFFRKAQNGVKFEGRERKIKDIKNSDNIFKINFPQENINLISFQLQKN